MSDRFLHRRDGFFLAEMLLYCVLLAVLVNLCTSLFLSARRVYALGEVSMSRMEALRDIESDVRRAAHLADAIADSVEGLSLPDVKLVLRGTGPDGETRYAVWRMGERSTLIHETYESRDRKLAILSQTGYRIDVRDFRAVQPEDNPRVVQISVDVDNEGTPNTIPATNTFVAQLRGGPAR